MTDPPPQVYVVHKPGGLSSTAHAVHILAVLLTCGLWLPGYILFIAFAPRQRQEVIAPAGYLQWPTPEQPPAPQRVGPDLLERRWVMITLYVLGAAGVAVIAAIVFNIVTTAR